MATCFSARPTRRTSCHRVASPGTGAFAYLSEDREDAALYRFLPDQASDPFRGRLQALRVIGQPAFETGTMLSGQSQPIDWVDVPNPDPQEDDVRYQAHDKGAARFVRTEGIWLHGSELYFCATAGGPIGRGQIFRLDLDDMRLTLLVQTTDTSVLDMPDNITVAPNGQLYVAEDGLDGNFIRRISPQGRVSDFARNAVSTSEFAGPCFSPDGSTLFVNIQHDGLTLAIRGPFAAEAELTTHHVEPQMRLPSTPELVGIGAGVAALALAALVRRKRTPSAPTSNDDAPPRSK
jgi:secreted PhoX family phosphatase